MRNRRENGRNKRLTPEERERRQKKQEQVRAALAAFKNATHARKKKTRGRVGPKGQILRLVEGNRFLMKFPRQRHLETIHVFDLDPVMSPAS